MLFSQQYDPTNEIRKLIQEGKYTEAEAQLTSLIKTAPAPEFYYLLGYSEFRRGSYLEAISSLEKALKGEEFLPKREAVASYYMLGYCYKMLSNIDKAITYLSDGITKANGTNLKPYMEKLLKELEAESEYRSWTKKEGKYVIFRYLNTKGYEERVKYLLPRFDKLSERYVKRFKLKLKKKISIFYYGNKNYFKKFFPKEDSCLIDIKHSSVYAFDSERFIPQFTHILLYKVANKNYPSLFITEGFNEYLLKKEHEKVDRIASFFNHTHKIPSYNNVNNLFFFKNYPESFDLAHSFISYVIKNVGYDAFLNFWKNGSGKIKKDFKKFFQVENFKDFYDSWISYVNLKKYGTTEIIRPIKEEYLNNGNFDLALKELKKIKGSSPLKKVYMALCYEALGKEIMAKKLLQEVECKTPQCMIIAGNLWDIFGKRELAKKYYQKILSQKDPPIVPFDLSLIYVKYPFKKNYLEYLKKGGKENEAYSRVRYLMRLGKIKMDKIVKKILENSNRSQLEFLFLNFPQPPDIKLAYLKGFNIPEIKKYTSGNEFFKNWNKVRKGIKSEYMKKFIISASKKLPVEKMISYLVNRKISFKEMLNYMKE